MLERLLIPALLGLGVSAGPQTSLTMNVRGLDNDRGAVLCAIFLEKDWLEDEQRLAGVSAKIVDGKATCVFEGLKPGTYGAVAFHDKNGNGKLDRNFMGLPSEDFCFSNDAKGGMGPPKFEKARMKIEGAAKTACKL